MRGLEQERTSYVLADDTCAIKGPKSLPITNNAVLCTYEFYKVKLDILAARSKEPDQYHPFFVCSRYAVFQYAALA